MIGNHNSTPIMSTPKKTVAFPIGHSRYIKGRRDGGAYSPTLKTNEWNFSMKLVPIIREIISPRMNLLVISEYPGSTYGQAVTFVSEELRKHRAVFGVESHFNAAKSPSANGHEWLYWHSSANGKRAALMFDQEFSKAFPQIRRRGLIARNSEKQNGGSILRRTPCPFLVLEPFFGSNAEDSSVFLIESCNVEKLATCYAETILKFVDTL